MTAVITRGAGCLTQTREPRQLWVFPVSTFGLDRLLRNRRGNVAMMYALVAPILLFGGGAAIDYGRAAQIHTKLNAAADAAALAALTPSMLQQSSDVAQAAAVSLFNGLTENIPGLTAHATQVTVTIKVGDTSLTRIVDVAYTSSVNTIFAQVLGKSTLPVGRLGGERNGAAQYRLLRPARQFPLDGAASHDGRHHQNAEPDDPGRDRRLRLRLPSRVHQHKLRYKRQPLRRRDDANPERSASVDVEGQLLLHDRTRRADRQLQARAQQQASRFAWTN